MASITLAAADIARVSSSASQILKAVAGSERDAALTAVYKHLEAAKDEILEANKRDMAAAEEQATAGKLSRSMIKRLDLNNPGKWEDMLQGILDVRDLEDPVGKITLATKLDDGLDLYRLTSPIGVLLVIFEARPEVIANITALALKSGNTAILKGGKESTQSFAAIARVVSSALATTSIPPGAIQLVETREDVNALLDQDQYIDLVIPRGSNELVRFIKDNTKIPVMGHADGLCAVYIHEDADEEKTVRVVLDAKTDYAAACNSMETLLVHESVSYTIFPKVASALLQAGVSLRCDPASKQALKSSSLSAAMKAIIQDATPQDYHTEFLELTLAIKMVPSVEEAITHINTHGSGHTDSILTESKEVAEKFMAVVDSAGVFWNASTRFADGFRYGFGTEVGISTNKIHARGPVGLEGLMIYKYQIKGNGQGAGDYGNGKKKYLHQKIEL
ncbi:glutamate-5-semialdehyde dehydrogenase [Maublancomyces gigas]|uniref:glutamate-5-semialdehyde dehydrogenase n=1 Tax=Discina gigas TaxID=1032678 RepID=A0ABR3GSI8_9PEZI